ncbi:recombinase family protein [Vibrio parahaemolyticus]|uniref:recombinase family protein n=1 Tax=Vibrio parahaemolyticus TaxID=670 RepID=UPI0010A9A999|nr:recombinase family protein [Vibrio parahaemolyticus]THE62136.1 recombinase family protein [Vibrio parahaemolyticus]
MRLFSYIRFSTEKQIEGDSIDRQTNSAKKYASLHGYDFQNKSFSDLGISGFKNVDRDGLTSMLEAIQSGGISRGDLIFIENVDRLTRQGFQHANDLIVKIVNSGVLLHFERESVTFKSPSDLNDMMSLMKVCMSASLAFEESQKKSERIASAKQKQRNLMKQGIAVKHKTPHWIEFDETGKCFHLGNTKIIKRVIELRRDGFSVSKIISTMNKEGFKAPYGGTLRSSTVKQWLQSPALYGAVMVEDELIKDYYPALMSYDEATKLYNKLTNNKAPENQNNHLRGLIYCSKCDSAMGLRFTTSSGKSKKKIPTFYCIKQREGGCDAPSVSNIMPLIEKMVSHMKTIEHKVDVAAITARIDEISANLERISKSVTTDNFKMMMDMMDKFEKEKRELQTSLTVSDDVDTDTLLSHIDNPVEFNNIARRYIDKIKVTFKGGTRRKRTFHFKLIQRNGHIVNLTRFGSGQITIGKTEVLSTFGKPESEFGEALTSLEDSDMFYE